MAKPSFKPGWISQIFFYFGAYVIFSAWQSQRHGGGIDYLTAFLISLPFFAIGSWLASRDRQQAMRDTNKLADWTLENALAAGNRGEPLPTMLYLRPFELTDQMHFKNPQPAGMMTPEYYSQDATLDLETLLAEELMMSTPLVALGEPGEHVGAGRLFSCEEDWRQSVQTMAHAVNRILILPSANAGTQWELQWLRNANLFGKCYFLMPPDPDNYDSDMAKYWSDTAKQLKEIGIDLPNYNPQGQIYTVDQHGHFDEGRSINLLVEGSFYDAINSLDSARKERTQVDSSDVSIESQQLGSAVSDIADDSSSIVTPKPRWRKTRTVSYGFIAVGFILVSLLIEYGGEPKKTTRENLVREHVPEKLRESITTEYLERLDGPVSGTLSPLELVTTSKGISMKAPADWEQQALTDSQGLLIRPTTGSLQCSLFSEDFPGEELDLEDFIAELDATTLSNGMRDIIASGLTGMSAQVKVETVRFNTEISDGTATIDYLFKAEMGLTDRSLRPISYSEGKRMLRGERFVAAQCDIGVQDYERQSGLVKRMLDSVEF